jgi:hypothetical protein
MALRIGEFLVQKGVLTGPQVDQILEHGKRQSLRFGEAGIDLGLLTEKKLVDVFGKNYRVDFFHVDARYFPQETKSVFAVEEILRWGALPLGSKTEYRFFRKGKILNVGLLDPGRQDAKLAIAAATESQGEGKKYTQLKFFLVLADQFLSILQSVYGVNPETLRKENRDSKLQGQGLQDGIDKTLAMFIEGNS